VTIKRMQKKTRKPVIMEDYDGLLSGVISLIDEARRVSSRTTNAIMTATYWEIGRRIVESEQAGKRRAVMARLCLSNFRQILQAGLAGVSRKVISTRCGPSISRIRIFSRHRLENLSLTIRRRRPRN